MTIRDICVRNNQSPLLYKISFCSFCTQISRISQMFALQTAPRRLAQHLYNTLMNNILHLLLICAIRTIGTF